MATSSQIALDASPQSKAVRSLIQSVLPSRGPIRIAAAYVTAKDAASVLGLGRRDLSRVLLLCDPSSGNCDPTVLDDLDDQGADVRIIPGLHAKVYLGSHTGVVGSANLTGAALVGGPSGTIEVATRISGRELAAAKKWFDSISRNRLTWRQVRETPALYARFSLLWARKHAMNGTRGGRAPKPRLLSAVLGDASFDWTDAVFSLVDVAQRVSSAEERRAEKVQARLGVSDERDGGYEVVTGAVQEDLERARSWMPEGRSLLVVTLNVRLRDNSAVQSAVSVDAGVSRFVGGDLVAGALFLCYEKARAPFDMSAASRRELVDALNAGLDSRTRRKRVVDSGDYVDVDTIRRLVALGR